MESISLADIVSGNVAQKTFYSHSGEVLISSGVTITERHLDVLRRRNIMTVYTKTADEEDELHRILSSDFKDLLNFQLDDPETDDKPLEGPAPILAAPEFRDIKKGADGLEQLKQSKQAGDLDKKSATSISGDKPSGPALKEAAQNGPLTGRAEEYKTQMSLTYENAIKKVRYVLNTLAAGADLSGKTVHQLSAQFVDTFISDKNILLNLSTTRRMEELYVYEHTLNTCLLAINIAAASGYSRDQVIEIGMAALLHDAGMLLVPQEIYMKKGALTPGELFEIHKHPILGLHLLERMTGLPEAVKFAAYHSHERENGTGYPKKRGSRIIHNYAKIVQIADIYDALSSNRPHRPALIPYKAMETLIKQTAEGLVSGEFVKAFLLYASLFPVGSLVELSDKSVGKVVSANGTSFAKPTICVLTDSTGSILPPGGTYTINLCDKTDIAIVRSLHSEHIPQIGLMDGF